MFKKPPADDFLKWIDNVPNDGLIAFQGIFHQPKVILTSTKALAEVLSQKSYDYEKPARLRSFLRRILGDGLVIVEGDEHKFQRKHIMPVFSFRHIKELYPMMWKKALALTQGVEAQMREHPELGRQEKGLTGIVEVNHWANKVTMDIIGVSALGTELNALKNSDHPLIQNYEELLEPTIEKLTYFAMQIVFPQALVNMLPWKVNDRVRVITGNLSTICARLVKEKRAAVKSNSEVHLDILSVLIQSNNFSDQQLIDQLLTFLAAG
jgi:cytochrome P450